MELENKINQHEAMLRQHEDKFKQHDKELKQIKDMNLEMQKSMNEGLARVDESNRFLREQNTRQSEQNTEILQAILNRNNQADIRDYEMKMLDKKNFWKAIFGIGAGAGTVIVAIVEILKQFGGR